MKPSFLPVLRFCRLVIRNLTAIVLVFCASSVAAEDRIVDAAARRDGGAVRALLAQHADVNAKSADGATALQWAAHWDDVELADLLIRAGADVNAANELGMTSLALACANGSTSMVARLLSGAANPNATTLSGETALMTAAHAGSVDVVNALLDRKADTSAREPHYGQTALMRAVAARHADVTRALLNRGADPNARSDSGFTPLLFAAQQGDVGSTRELLRAGARINDSADDGNTPLLVASASLVAATASNYKLLPRPSEHEAVALLLIESGADVRAADGFGRTSLHAAVETRKRQLVGALLAHGADPNARLSKGLPYRRGDYVSRAGYAGATPLWFAARIADADLMSRLLAAGADPMAATTDNTTSLMIAVGLGEADSRLPPEPQVLEAVKVAIQSGCEVNAVHKRSGQSALHIAASLGRTTLIQYLVDHGAKPEMTDRQGRTALAIAEDPRRPRKEAADLLRSLGHQ